MRPNKGEPRPSPFEDHTVDGRNPLRTTLGNYGKPLFVGIYRGIESFQGFLRGAGFRPSTVRQ